MNILDDIPRTPVDSIALAASNREDDHGLTAFELVRETTMCVGTFAGAMRETTEEWSLNEAVVGGQFVRLAKLLNSFMQQIAEERGELAWITSRLVVESCINILYLTTNFSDALVRSYLLQSLQHDGELLRTIQANISARNGVEQPIEQRMQKSIARTFKKANLTPDDLPQRRIQNWGNKTLREKAKSLDLDNVYQGLIASSSRNVHGSWADLTQHHLEVTKSGNFIPRFDEIRVRPQLMYTTAYICIKACIGYLDFMNLDGEQDKPIRGRLDEIELRVRTADRLHEQYLTRKQDAV